MAGTRERVVKTLLDRHGVTYAEQARIRLADRPSALYQLLVLATLLSARISADVAVAAAREGPAGADIFLREVQAVWPDVAPYVDDRVSEGAKMLRLPSSARGLSGLVGSPRDMARLAAALVRVALERGVADEVKQAVS